MDSIIAVETGTATREHVPDEHRHSPYIAGHEVEENVIHKQYSGKL